MGPTNVALVKLFQADQALREAQARLDAAGKDVRVQERKVNDLAEKLRLAQQKLLNDQAVAVLDDVFERRAADKAAKVAARRAAIKPVS